MNHEKQSKNKVKNKMIKLMYYNKRLNEHCFTKIYENILFVDQVRPKNI